MPPRCTAPCRCAVFQSFSNSAQDGIWITDSMLHRAFERYQRHQPVISLVSSQSRRNLTSCPGPIESRRRLGKRHMTGMGMMPLSQTSPAPWAFDLPAQLGEWKWYAPTSSQDRKKQREKFSIARLLDNAIERLEHLGEEPPWSQPPQPLLDAMGSAKHMESLAEQPSELQSYPEAIGVNRHVGTSIASTIDTGTTRPMLDLVEALHFNIGRLRTLNRTGLEEVCDEFRQGVESLISRKMATSNDLMLAFDPFNYEIKKLVSDHDMPDSRDHILDNLRAFIGKSIIEAIASIGVEDRAAYDTQMWLNFVEETCFMTPQEQTFDLFKKLMDVVPRSPLNKINPELIVNMTKGFVSFEAARALDGGSSKPRPYFIFPAALRRITPEQSLHIQESMTDYLNLNESTQPEKLLRKMRYSWFMIMAHDRHTTTDEFLHATQRAQKSMLASPWRAFPFLKGRLWALRCIDAGSVQSFICSKPNDRGWKQLLASISMWKRDEGVQELCHIISNLSCSDVAFDVLVDTLVSAFPSRMDIFRAVAIHIDDHRRALQLWEAFNARKRSTKDMGEWDWSAWAKYVEAIIKDPEIEFGCIWSILNLGRNLDNEVDPSLLPDGSGITTKTDLLENMALYFLEAPHLSDRQILRQIEWCLAAYQALRKPLSSTIIASLARLVTRDLEQGQFGRSTRLDYLVSLTAKHVGEEEADRVLEQIRGWRWTIVNRG